MADVSPDPPTPPQPDSVPADDSPPVWTAPPSAVTDKESPPLPAVAELPAKSVEAAAAVESEKRKAVQEEKFSHSLVSFKEESNRAGDLSEIEGKALEELKKLVQEALNSGQFTAQSPSASAPAPASKEERGTEAPEKEEKQEAQLTTIQEVLTVSSEPTSDTRSAKEIPASEAEISGVSTRESKDEERTPLVTAVTDSAAPEAGESVVTKGIEKSTCEEQIPVKEITTSADEVSVWGIPLMKDDRSDVILLKFLRARDFKVKDAFVMIKNTIRWRKEFRIDDLLDEDLGDDLDKVVFMHNFDREGHPVCYNVYGEFQNKELYNKTFSDEEKRWKFLRWRIQFLERSIRKLDFSPGSTSTIFQVNDLKNSPGPGKRELRQATKQALHLLQDNYPEFVAKQVFINVPWWYLAFYTMISPFLTQRTKSKFVFAGPSKTTETLFKYISPEQVPIQYGGLSVDSCHCNPEFCLADPVTEVAVKPASKQAVEILVSEKCFITWEIRVVGWEVSYGAEFVPYAEDGYTVIIHKATKMAPTDEPVVCKSFKIDELGKVVLTVNNPTSKKKKLLYRFKTNPLPS
ncbi:patellin-3-like [Malania oleifera]|uniref:patellin-3-like n=1 Tax=Malania oleifera TaxID=397392 RepID=UPI0025AEB4B0|nr:patellin-3-like [Malania oleifera]